MTKYLIQHGSAKGSKIEKAIKENICEGVVFSPREEIYSSILTYCNNDFLNKDNVFYDPQMYYSRYDSSIYKKLDKNLTYPIDISRRDWRLKTDNIMDYIKNHVKESEDISNSLITPGFYIDSLDWKFDQTIDIYEYCRENYTQFHDYYMSLIISIKLFYSKNDIDELLEDINDNVDIKNGIYFFLVHESVDGNGNIKNYEYIDEESLSNVLYFVNKLKNMGFKILSGYNFINTMLFAMLDVDYISSGWFNTLRKFSVDRFENVETFGIRKKRYTSIPLLSYFTGELAKSISEKTDISFIVSDTIYDSRFLSNYDSLSFVDYEQQYWMAMKNIISEFNEKNNVNSKILLAKEKIRQAINNYEKIIKVFEQEQQEYIVARLKLDSIHLNKWLLAIELFEKKALILD